MLYTLTTPSDLTTPVLVDVPHAGEREPDDVAAQLIVPFDTRRADFDLFVDQFWRDAPGCGATMLVAANSRYVVDLNRHHQSVDAGSVSGHSNARGSFRRGLIWQVTSANQPVLARPIARADYEHRVRTYHLPYHHVLNRELERIRERFGHVALIDAHSMPSVGREDHLDIGRRRADIVPGTNHGKACSDALTALCVEVFSGHGYSIAIDDPYRGGWITRNYGRPAERSHAIQVEVNRALYMDEQTFEIDTEGLERLRVACRDFTVAAGAWVPKT